MYVCLSLSLSLSIYIYVQMSTKCAFAWNTSETNESHKHVFGYMYISYLFTCNIERDMSCVRILTYYGICMCTYIYNTYTPVVHSHRIYMQRHLGYRTPKAATHPPAHRTYINAQKITVWRQTSLLVLAGAPTHTYWNICWPTPLFKNCLSHMVKTCASTPTYAVQSAQRSVLVSFTRSSISTSSPPAPRRG